MDVQRYASLAIDLPDAPDGLEQYDWHLVEVGEDGPSEVFVPLPVRTHPWMARNEDVATANEPACAVLRPMVKDRHGGCSLWYAWHRRHRVAVVWVGDVTS